VPGDRLSGALEGGVRAVVRALGDRDVQQVQHHELGVPGGERVSRTLTMDQAIEPPAKAISQSPWRGFATQRNSNETPRKINASNMTITGRYMAGMITA